MAERGRGYDVEDIRRRFPLLDVVAGVQPQLRRAGRAVTCRCPLGTHRDSDPSFYVYVAQGRFYCYGCHRHGDVIDFVRLQRGLPDFRAACEYLVGAPDAAPVHPERLPGGGPAAPGGPVDGAPGPGWEELTGRQLALIERIAAHYTACLVATPALRRYVGERVPAARVLQQCRVGFADGESLAGTLRPRERALAVELGLLVEVPATPGRPGGLREFLARRIVVPEIRDGRPIWFIGRRRPEIDAPPALARRVPKYKALPGPRPVLGLERARGRAESLLVEGPFDYLVALAWELPGWSTCGTALPPARLDFLADTARVFGGFDGDRAGREGNARVGALLGPRHYPLALPEGRDIADLARLPDGRERLLALIDRARREGDARNAALAAELAGQAVRTGRPPRSEEGRRPAPHPRRPGAPGSALAGAGGHVPVVGGAHLAAPPSGGGYADWVAERYGEDDRSGPAAPPAENQVAGRPGGERPTHREE